MSKLAHLLASIIIGIELISRTPPGESDLGYIILPIIASPVIILLLATLIGRPRSIRITVLFLGFLGMMFVGFIAATFILGLMTSIFF